MPVRQHKKRDLVLFQHRAPSRSRLETAFMRLPMHLGKDVNPSLWRNRRRSSNALRVPGLDVIRASHMVLNAAIQSRDHALLERTAEEVSAYGYEILAAMLAPYTDVVDGPISLNTEGLSANRELHAAAHAITEAMVTKSPSAIDESVRKATTIPDRLRRWANAARRTYAASIARAVH